MVLGLLNVLNYLSIVVHLGDVCYILIIHIALMTI